jgi:hypothetical protein
MSTQSASNAFVIRIQKIVGCSKDLAGDYAAAIGDTPEIQNGEVVVRDERGRVIAHLPQAVIRVIP